MSTPPPPPTPSLEPEIRQMYQRFLASWAMDTLSLRSAGLDRPCPRGANVLAPAGPGTRSDAAECRDNHRSTQLGELRNPRHAA